MGRGTKENCTEKGHFSHVDHDKYACSGKKRWTRKLRSLIWTGMYMCLWFTDGEMLHERPAHRHCYSYHGAWQCLQRAGFPFCKTSRGLADPKGQDHGVISTPKSFWRGNSSTAFLLPPFLLCLTHRWSPPPAAPLPMPHMTLGENTVVIGY